jgi:hypothetical protein
MQVSQEKAIDLQDFRRAEELKAEIKDKREELETMEKAMKPQADSEVEMVRKYFNTNLLVSNKLRIIISTDQVKEYYICRAYERHGLAYLLK